MKQVNYKKSLTALAVAGALAMLVAPHAQADTTTATIMGQTEDGSSVSSGLMVDVTPYYSKSDDKTYPYTSIRTETGVVANDWNVMNNQKNWPQGGRSGWWGTYNYSLGHLTNAGYGLQTYTADDEEVKNGKKQVGDFKKMGTNRYAYDTTKQYNYTMAWGAATNASSSFATAWGETTAATGMYSTAFGYWTEARGTHALAAGNKSKATKDYSFAFGDQVQATARYAVAYGWKTAASGEGSFVVGNKTEATGYGSFAFGSYTTASGWCATAGGSDTVASGQATVALGLNSKATGDYSVAIGTNNEATNAGSLAIGYKSVASGQISTAIGNNSTAAGYRSTAIGHGTTGAEAKYSIALGFDAATAAAYSTALGHNSAASGKESTAIGGGTTTEDAENGIAFGTSATASALNAIAIGTESEATGEGSAAFGYLAKATDKMSTALGARATATGQASTAIGNNAVAGGQLATALGTGSRADGAYSTALGYGATAFSENSVSVGGSVVTAAKYGTALGWNSTTATEGGVALGYSSYAGTAKGITGWSPTDAGTGSAWTSTAAAVSVGDYENDVTRQISSVAAGTADTDAVNVAQLKAVYSDLNDRIGEAAEGASDTHVAAGEYTADADGKVTLTLVDKDGKELENQTVTITDVAKASDLAKVDAKVGDLAYSKVEGTVIADSDSVTEAIGKLNNRASDALAEAAKHTTVSAGSNIEVKQTEKDGQKNYEVSLKKNIAVDSVTAGDAEGGNSFTASSDGAFANYGDTNVSIDAADGFSAGKGSTYVQADGKTAELGTETSGIAASDGKLQIAGGSTTVTVTDAGADFGGAKATGIAAAELSASSTDAVNGSQLYATNQKVDENSSNIEKLYRKTGDLNKKLNRTGANAAALAALHPLDFDENHKVSASVGFGQYHGSSALAVGVFVRPTENLMFNLGGSFASDDKMFNAGVSYRFGDNGAKPVATNAQMADRVNSLTAENRDLSAQLKASNTKLESVASENAEIRAENATLRAEIEAIKAKLGMK